MMKTSNRTMITLVSAFMLLGSCSSLDSSSSSSSASSPAYSGDYVLVSESFGTSLAKIDPRTNQLLSRIEAGNLPQFIAADLVKRIAYVPLYNDARIAAILPDTLEAAFLDIPDLGQQPIGATLTADGRTLLIATRGSDGAISVDDRLDIVSLDPSVWPPAAYLAHSVYAGLNPITACIDHNGDYAVITVRDEPSILIMDMTDYSIVSSISGVVSGDEPEGCATHPTEPVAYVTLHGSNALLVIDLDTLQLIQAVQVVSAGDIRPNPSTVQFAPDGTRAFVQAQSSNQVLLFDTSDPRHPVQDMNTQLAVGAQPHFIAWLPEDRAYVANTGSDASTGSVSVLAGYSGAPTVSDTVLTELQGPLSFAYFTAQ